MSKKCKDGCDCVPVADGWYWATYRLNGVRQIVLIDRDGHKHRRAFTARYSRSLDPSEFTDYSDRLIEPRKK